MHVDPEFQTFTYGDPGSSKAGLRYLEPDDILAFYAGLEGWDFYSEPALYLVGYFEVSHAGFASSFGAREVEVLFGRNAHVRNCTNFENEKARLVIVKGSGASRLLSKAHCISEMGTNRVGQPLKVLSKDMQQIFGHFDGRISIQRSPTRWVRPAFVQRAGEFVRSLP